MNSVKSILENFESLSDNVKIYTFLYGDSRLDGNKNKFVLEALLYVFSFYFSFCVQSLLSKKKPFEHCKNIVSVALFSLFLTIKNCERQSN